MGWSVPAPTTRLARDGVAMGPELGALPPQIGKAALRWRSELPPETAAGSSLPAGGAARQGALLAQRSGVPVLGLSPGGRDLPRATG